MKALFVACVLLAAACSGSVGETVEEDLGAVPDDLADVVGASAMQTADGTWTFGVTLSSPHDSPEQYADAWRIVTEDGTELGIRELTHDHANEQPFTRSLSGVVIPDGVDVVIIEGRDSINGWGGAVQDLDLDRDG